NAPRAVLSAGATDLREMASNRNDSLCCGAGGAQFFKEEEEGERRVSEARLEQALATGAEVVATGCPFCKSMLGSSSSAQVEGAPAVLDVAQLVAARLDSIQALLDG
ncbi:MAG: (Fe-S)-binding protein, partial [Trueperaceae bacterium]|nr:(Fe-S)-binding protein [Trueperaceae bacterium]